MSRIPYLFRRGNVFYFRAAVPAELRDAFQCREVIQSLRTEKRAEAVPKALGMAAQVTKLFNDVRAMSDIKHKRQLLALREKQKIMEARHQEELEQQELNHLADIRRAKSEAALIAENEALKAVVLANTGNHNSNALHTKIGTNTPKLSIVITDFLGQYDQNKVGMLKKHRTALSKFLEVIGDKPVSQIKHVDINRFFAGGLAQHHNASFKNYKSSIKQLVEWTRGMHEGAFADVHTGDIKYSGNRTQRENSQRSFKGAELSRLFTCSEMQKYCQSGADVHKFWLPVIGLYSGTRVNEICQLNPFEDIRQGEGGIWYFQITEETEAAEGVRKSVKTAAGKRVVPVHSKLIELGILDYVDSVKKAGHKSLFPQWEIMQDRAGENPARWFRRFLDTVGLRDETKGKKLVGMHAFRKTVLTRAYRGKFVKDMLPIVGHEADLIDETGRALPAVTMDYIDDEALEIPLAAKKETIEKLQFDIPFYKPVKPVFKK